MYSRPKQPATNAGRFLRRAVGATLVMLLYATSVNAEFQLPAEVRLTESIVKIDEVAQYALVFHGRSPRALRANRSEIAIGQLTSPKSDHVFVSYGAVWRLPQRWMPIGHDVAFVDVGFSPTWVSGSRMNGQDIGGSFHFTSSVAIGRHLNRKRTLEMSLRFQHTSNGGLNRKNPGLDMVGLSVSYRRGRN